MTGLSNFNIEEDLNDILERTTRGEIVIVRARSCWDGTVMYEKSLFEKFAYDNKLSASWREIDGSWKVVKI